MKISFMPFVFILMFLCCSINAFSQSPLFIPDTLSGSVISLTIKDSIKQFFPGYNTNTIGYNGNFLGPTVFLNKGQNVTFNVQNKMTDTTTTHWHGLHVSPMNDGGPHTEILPSATWSPSFTVMDNAATYWYHPHTHMKTMQQVVKGGAGLIIVRDSVEASLTLPRKYGVDDIPLMFQFKTMDSATKQFGATDFFDNVLMVNGTINPYVNSPAQVVRYRILNASSMRNFNFGFHDNRIFYQITSDNGLLDAPVPLTRLVMGVGERAEILVDLSADQGDTVFFNTFSDEFPLGFPGGPGVPTGDPIGPLDDTIMHVLQINVIAPTTSPVTAIPTALTTNTVWPSAGVPVKVFTFQEHPAFLIDSTPYNMNVNNFVTQLDDVQIWEVKNITPVAHPFHIHGNHFYILTRQGIAPPPNEQGRKDVVLIPPQETVQLITKYETFCDSMMPYMYHCHILKHEDMGMMGQFLVQCSGSGISEIHDHSDILIYPNPSGGMFNVQWLMANGNTSTIVVYNVLGKKVFEIIHENKPTMSMGPHSGNNQSIISIDLSDVSSGIYFLKLESGGEYFTRKIVIEK